MIPSDIASLAICHEARDHVGAVGTAVSQLLGKYGKPNSQVQGTPGKRPTIQLTVNDALPCLRFDNTDDEIFLDASTSLAGPYTIFHVFATKPDATSAGYMPLAGEPAFNGGWGNSWYMLFTDGSSNIHQLRAYPTGGNEINSFTLVPDEVKIHMAQMGTPFSTGLKYRIGNSLIGSGGDATGPGILSLGRMSDGHPAHMDWLATIGFSAELSNGDRDGMFNYIVSEILGGGGQYMTQLVVEEVGGATPILNMTQFVIEYIREVGNPFYHTQVMG